MVCNSFVYQLSQEFFYKFLGKQGCIQDFGSGGGRIGKFKNVGGAKSLEL